MLFQVGCLKLLLVAEHLQPGCSSVPACGSLRLGCASVSSISGSTAVTPLWPSSHCLFTCRGMQSYVSPNLCETTCPVTQTTGKRRNMALVPSDSTCHTCTLIGRWLVLRECCTLSEFGVAVKVHLTSTCRTHTRHCPVGRLSSLPQLRLWKFRVISSLCLVLTFKWGQSFCPKEFHSWRPPMVDVPCWFGKYGKKENWQIRRKDIRYDWLRWFHTGCNEMKLLLPLGSSSYSYVPCELSPEAACLDLKLGPILLANLSQCL